MEGPGNAAAGSAWGHVSPRAGRHHAKCGHGELFVPHLTSPERVKGNLRFASGYFKWVTFSH